MSAFKKIMLQKAIAFESMSLLNGICKNPIEGINVTTTALEELSDVDTALLNNLVEEHKLLF